MNIEAQLLQIIEQQQEQLKQQQQLIEQKCEQLNLVQEQLNKTLKEQDKLLNALENLDQYTSRHVDSLTTHFNQVEEKIKSLENRALPVNFLNSLQQNLEQQQIQRHRRDAEKGRLSQIARREHDNNDMCRETVRRARPECEAELRTGQWDKTAWGREGGTLNESRSTTLANYRATTRAIETATAAIRTEMRAVEFSTRSIEQNIERTRPRLS